MSKLTEIVKIVETGQNCQTMSKLSKNVQTIKNCQKLSKLSKIVKIVRIVKNCQKKKNCQNVGQLMFPHHSGQMSQRSQVFGVAL